ncbi:MAG: xanthine dehydrogenase family protein molybdopterin-binding subunit, partial [Actinomycetota bacterium]
MVATEPYIGRTVLRKEDPKLLTGQASYIDNWTMSGMVWMAMVRPPFVHARITSIDTSEAAGMPGVLGVFTAGDLEVGGLPFVWPIT